MRIENGVPPAEMKKLGDISRGETFYYLGNLCMMVKSSRNGSVIVDLKTSELLPDFKFVDEYW